MLVYLNYEMIYGEAKDFYLTKTILKQQKIQYE